MKKVLVFTMLTVFILGLGKVSFAQLEEKKVELAKVKKYIILLDGKIKKARDAKQINKIAEVNELKRSAEERAKKLADEIAEMEKGKTVTKSKVKTQPVTSKGQSGLQASVGLSGGSLMLGIGHRRTLQSNMDLVLDAGLGIGNSFSVLTAGVSGVMMFNENYAGLRLGFTSYSETVSNVPGLSGNVDKGGKIGLGIFGGKSFDKNIKAQIGYDTALGLNAGVVYIF